MNRKVVRFLPAIMTTLFAAAVFGFFGFCYPYHLHYQEQFQMFLFTWDYFREVAWVPGGLADYAGRFFTQLFFQARLGAACLALLLAAQQVLTWKLMRRKSPILYPLSFVPSILLIFFFLDEHAMLGAIVGLLLVTVATSVERTHPSFSLQSSIYFIGIPLLYLTCGPLAIAYVLIAPFRLPHSRKIKGGSLLVGGLLLLAICIVCASLLFPYPPERFLLGIHYHRYPYVTPGWLWIAVLAEVLLAIPLPQVSSKPIANFALAIIVAGGAVFGTVKIADMKKEEAMKYDFMVRMGMWNRLMMTADKKAPTSPMTVTCLNLALAKTGRMGDHMFSYYQNGTEGLLPPFVRDFTSPLPTAEAYYHLGMVNTAQRFIFEAQEGLPDFQKSARCYKRLAETNIINGDYGVARTYLIPLTHTLFYRRWARATLPLLGDEEGINSHPEYGRLRRWRLRDHDFLFSESEMDSMLGLLCVEQPDNDMAFQYLLAWSLLRRDLSRFSECLHLRPLKDLPRHSQEALLFLWSQTHDSFDGLPPYLSSRNASRMQEFIQAVQGGKPKSYIRSHFAGTYWNYLVISE